MNRYGKAALILVLLSTVLLVGWTELVDNFMGKDLDATFKNPPDTAMPVFSTATKKWSAIAGGGGAASDASTVTKGITKLTVPPASATSPIAVGANDPSVNPTPTAANAGNIPVVPTGGGAYTHIDPPAGTDTFLASLGTAVPGAFRAIIDTDIDELLTFEQLVDVTITGAAAGDIIIRNAGNTLWVNQAKGSPSTVFLVDSGGGMPTYGLVTSAMISNGTITDIDVDSANKDGVAGTASMRTLGTGAQQAAAGNDSRLSDARTPTAHAASHQNGGSDEVATATPGANAIPKADGSNKLASGWLSEVLNLVDLLDVTFTSLANNDILMRIGGSWVNAVSAGDVTWTGSGNTITTVIGALKVTNAMLAGSIADAKLASSYLLADGTRALTADWGVGNRAVTGVKELRFQGQAGDPGGFAAGGISYDSTKGVHRFRSATESASGWRVLASRTSRITVGPSSAAIGAIGTSITPAQSGTAVYPAGTVFRYTASGRINFVGSEAADFQFRINSSTGTLIAGFTGATLDATGTSGAFVPFDLCALITLRGDSSSSTSIMGGGSLKGSFASGVRLISFDNGGTATTSDWSSITSIQPFFKFTNSNANNEVRVEEDLWEVCTP